MTAAIRALMVATALVAGACSAGQQSADASSSAADADLQAEGAPETGDRSTEPTGADSAAAASGPLPTPPADASVDFDARPAVAPGEQADFGSGLLATVTAIEPVELEARAPGETAGPGAAVSVRVSNQSDGSVDLGGIAVNARTADGTPASPNTADPADPFEGDLAPGGSADAVYLFRAEPADVGSLRIDLHHAGSPNILVVTADRP